MDPGGGATSIPTDENAAAAAASPAARPSRRKRFGKLALRIWLAVVAGFVLYFYLSYRATGFDAAAVLRSDARVSVTDADGLITFAPVGSGGGGGNAPRASLVFIPGAMVEPTAYAPLANVWLTRHTLY
jgi:hypothetical protein